MALSFDKNNDLWAVSSCLGAAGGQSVPNCSVNLRDFSWVTSVVTGHGYQT